MADVYKSIKDIPEVTTRNQIGRPNPYQRALKSWHDQFDNHYVLASQYDPFDNYDKALGSWTKFHENKIDPEYSGAILEFLKNNKDVIQSATPRDWIATRPHQYDSRIPEDIRKAIGEYDGTLAERVAFAKGFTKNGDVLPRHMIGYLTSFDNIFTDPYEDKQKLTDDIINYWGKL